MPILIDGHNLIGRLPQAMHLPERGLVPVISLKDAQDEDDLVRWLMSYRARTGKAITVIFDPGETYISSQVHHLGGLTVVFAPHGTSADDVIVRKVRSGRNPQAWLVVTSDQELAETVSRLGARVQSAEAFIAEVVGGARRLLRKEDTPLSPEEVQAWLALFEGEDPQKSTDDGD